MAALEFQYRDGGIYFPLLRLWLDPHRPKAELTFVSHAHSDHTARHHEVILTEPTACLMQARLGGKRLEHLLRFGECRSFQKEGLAFQLTLLPAGHILGSAMALVECAGESLLYTGDFKLRPGLAAEVCQPRPAAVLVMETTFGKPRYRFPDSSIVMDDLRRFCRESIESGANALLHCYSLGKSQEVLLGLAGLERPVLLQEATFAMTKIYERFGHAFPAHEKLGSEPVQGRVVLCPPGSSRKAAAQLGVTRSAVITGWALDPGCRYQYGCDAAFPLSDHADYPGLLEFVRQVRPRRVHTLHGFAGDFAATLRREGFEAWSLTEADQLELNL